MLLLEKVTDSVNRYLALQKIVEQGSFTRAAQALGYTQSAMSQMIASLEAELSIRLLIRPRTGVCLTLEAVPLELLVKEPFILLEEDHYYEPLEGFHTLDVMPDVKYTIRDDDAIMTMAEAGLGISILAELILHWTNCRLALRPTVPAVSRTIAVGYRDWNSLPIASKHFIDSLRKRAEELP